MSFSSKVKEEVLVCSARHCCVCHRYCGVGIEVHHIIPKEKGGDDLFENAIPLCFDCHANAGHYNPKHPRGTKYSPRELEKARENWYEQVKNRGVKTPAQFAPELLIKHLKTNNWEILTEIVNGNYAAFPEKNIFLYKNETFKFFERLVNLYKNNSRPVVCTGNYFDNIKDLFDKRPNIKGIPNRELSENEKYNFSPYRDLQEGDKEYINDPIAIKLVENGAKLKEVADVSYDWLVCGDGPASILEAFTLKKISFTFLVIKNVSDNMVTIQSYGDSIIKSDFCYKALLIALEEKGDIQEMPKMKLEKDQTIVIPQFAFIDQKTHNFNLEVASNFPLKEIGYGYVQSLDYLSTKHELKEELQFGPINAVKFLEYYIEGYSTGQTIKIHEFDNNNLFIVDRFWECGSCPHIYLYSDEQWSYFGETVFSESVKTHQHLIQKSVLKIALAEIEKEESFFEKFEISDKTGTIIYENSSFIMKELDCIIIEVGSDYKPPFLITAKGYHRPHFNVPFTSDILYLKRLKAKSFCPS